MSELLPQSVPSPSLNDITSMSAQHLRAELVRSLAITARHLVYLAAVWAELEKRGEDLSDLRTGMAAYLPQIAAGQLDAEAVIRFAGSATVLRNVAALPIEQQRRLTQGDPVRVLTVGRDGSYGSVELPAYALTSSQARLVFDAGKLRSFDEQRAILESERINAKRRAQPEGKVRYDNKSDVLRIGRSSATVGEVLAALTERTDERLSADEPTKVLMIHLTETMHRMIKIRAAEAGIDMQELARRALRKFLVL